MLPIYEASVVIHRAGIPQSHLAETDDLNEGVDTCADSMPTVWLMTVGVDNVR